MVCEHLHAVEDAVRATGATETARGQIWSHNCREWVYFDRVLDLASLRAQLPLAPCIEDHENTDPRSGLERGLVCTIHWDGIMGLSSD